MGIEATNRAAVERLHRSAVGPFDIDDASQLLALDHARTVRLLRYLAARGWLSRVRRGLYTTVPLGADTPSAWRDDPWVVAAKLFAPCYVAGWSALAHWNLTEQLFRTVAIVTSLPVRKQDVQIQGVPFRVKRTAKRLHFGLHTVWRDRVRVPVSDPSRTLIDVLDDPAFGGGIRHVAAALVEYWDSEHRDESKLAEYAARLGNRTVYKRLGFILETMGIEAATLIATCRRRMSAGASPLDPSITARGRIVTRWNLRVNAALTRGETT